MTGPTSRRSWFDAVAASVLAFGRYWRRGGRRPHGSPRWRRSVRGGRVARLHGRLGRKLGRLGQLDCPGGLLTGIDLEESGSVEPARQAVGCALDGELPLARAHERLSRPFSAVIIVDRIDVIEAGD